MWMKTFPDTLEQFGYVLLKTGKEFRIGDCQVCNYKKVKLNKKLPLEKFNYSAGHVTKEVSFNRKVLYVPASCDSCKEILVLFGPYMSLGIGDFTARFYLKALHAGTNNPVALLDVTSGWGAVQLAAKKITKHDFASDDFQYIALPFKTTERHTSVEFRIYNYGQADLYFDHIELIEN
jgi:hypothetical protein